MSKVPRDYSWEKTRDYPPRFQGVKERWRICPNSHCERHQECRSPHECSGTGKNVNNQQASS